MPAIEHANLIYGFQAVAHFRRWIGATPPEVFFWANALDPVVPHAVVPNVVRIEA
jgi:hypothetical protein